MKTIENVLFWIANKRLLDGQIGILKINLWFRIWAMYSTILEIFYLALNIFGKNIFIIAVQHHVWNNREIPYPFISVNLSIFGFKIYSNTVKQDKNLSEWGVKYSKESQDKENRIKEIIKLYDDGKLVNLDV